MRLVAAILAGLAALAATAHAQETRPWAETLARARGQTVYWNAWGGDDRNNAYIAWVGEEVRRRYGVTLNHVKLSDTADAVTRVVAEKAAGRREGGTVDLIWLNGANLAAMKAQGLLHGPITGSCRTSRASTSRGKPATVVDFTLPVDGMASPWLMAQIVFVYDGARTQPGSLPRTMPAMLDWARRHPGRLTHPVASNFLGATFLKQAPVRARARSGGAPGGGDRRRLRGRDRAALRVVRRPASPHLWRGGREFPESGPAMRQLLADGEIDLMISFNPAEAVLGASSGLLPGSARTLTLEKGSIGNASFVAIPFNAAHKDGALVVAELPARAGGAGPRAGPGR